MGKGMNRKEQRNSRMDKYNTMIKKGPSAKAAQEFHRKAFSVGAPGIRNDSESMIDYLAKKYDVKKEMEP